MFCLVGFCTVSKKAFEESTYVSSFQSDFDVQFVISLISHEVLAEVYCKSMYHIIQTTHLSLNKGNLSLKHQFQNIQKLFGLDLKTGGCQGKL